MIYGVIIKIGIDNAMNNVCNCVNTTDNPIPLAVPINIERKVPAQVGHAINNPVTAPMLLILRPFLESVYALIAIDAFIATRYETTICSTKFIGIICNPTCSVRYTMIFGIYPGPSQHGAINPDGIVAP